MCGIVGLTGPRAGAAVEAMRDALAHWGPDGSGLYEDEHLALGQRRLAILDLTPAAKQPFANESGSIQVVFNGEIYNYVELRKELEQKGKRFRSQSDTEVIVQGYEVWGESVLERLNGMFAIALYAKAERKLLLARDRAGEKPLHWGWLEGKDGTRRFVFASELRAVLACPLTHRPRPDARGIARFLSYEYVPAPDSALEGLSKLAGGEALALDLASGETRVWRYWRPSFGADQGKLALSFEEAKARLAALLEESVKIRLRSDVPLGVFLSGGVDSSTVAAIARRLLPSAELRTFSIGFEERAFDETSHARKVAAHLGTRHSEETVSERVLLEVLPQVLAHQDEPLADASLLPTTIVSRLARREVTVVLGGDGGDELFCGYDPFKAWTAARLYELVPSAVHSSLALPLAGALPSSQGKVGLDFKVKRFLRGAVRPRAVRIQAWMSAFEASELGSILAPELRAALGDDALACERLYEPTVAAWDEAGPVGEVDRQSAVYLRTYLQDGVLQKVDRASMSCSLETRAPFLDPEVMAFAFRLEPALKYRRLETKILLKALARELVPPEVVDRPKQGFGVPLARWLRGALRPLVEETLAPDRVRAGGLLDAGTVATLVERNALGKADPRQIWTLLVLETWRQRWLG
jgi:asparagine synthase (glutamine-hydrolysing)